MKFTANQIAEILEGEIVGDPLVEVSTLSKIEEGKEGSLTFLSNPKYTSYIYDTEASVVVVNKSFEPEKEIRATLLKVEDAYKAFTQLLEFYNQIKLSKTGIEEPCFISKSATVGESPYIGAFAYIGENVRLGDNVKIYPNSYIGDNVAIDDNTIVFSGVRIYSDTKIGKNCMINSGSVIGADGFGFVPNEEGVYKKVPQIGNVILEDNVDIGAATTIDRATLGSTIIRKGVKLDNHIQVAHNVDIGENTVIASQTGIAGSTKIGKNCQIGGQVGFAGHLIIGNDVKIQAQSGVGKNLNDKEVVQGSHAFNFMDWNKSYIHFRNFPKLAKQINELEKELKALKEE
ncbi:MAG: UDP-3-O-(3-hydroxymyristoyl)glucosamine N-acyltransferase [Flavobacteriaceae bacterium]